MSGKFWIVGSGAIIFVVGALALRVASVARRTASASALAVPTASARARAALQVAETAYDGKLGNDWQDWGWGPHDLPKSGAAKVNFAGYGGIALHHPELAGNYGGLSFQYKPPSAWPEFLTVKLRRTGGDDRVFPLVSVEPRHVAPSAGGWREVLIDWSELDPQSLPIDGVSIAARSSVSSEWVLIDKVVFTKSSTAQREASTAPSRDVVLSVACDGPTHAINPLIYGAAAGDWDSGQSAQRLGGNPMTRLNWDTGNLWNAGNDWFFENGKAGGNLTEWIAGGISHAAPTALVVPMIGWVSKDATSVGFPKSRFPKQRKFDLNRPDAGDGFRPDGSPILPGSPTETSVSAPPEVIGRWIRSLAEQDRARGSRGVQMYILDNEPSLWNVTHRDVHPEPLGYDELLDRTVRYATDIRDADPGAQIAGPAEWGWNGYLYSAKDQAIGVVLRPDRRLHGDLPLVAWYLRQLAERERSSGKRLLDVLDLHFYPAAPGVYGRDALVDPGTSELRLRSTRALWDPNYHDESWIKEPIGLIPRMKAWVAENYPGLKTSIGEWSFGADAHISGGLATAEALGRFGQQGLDSAFYWDGPKKDTATFWAFRAFRNFDGEGGRFLDVSLPTRGAEKVSLFASRDESGTHIVAIILNLDASFAVNAELRLATCGQVVSRRMFSYGRGSNSLTEVPSSALDAPVVLPPYSLVVIDMRLRRP